MITAQKLIRKVRYLINETENDCDVTLITDDLRSIDDTILELLPQAVSIVQRQSKGKYVNVKALLPEKALLNNSSDGYKQLVLPSDFAVLVSIRLGSWKTSCVEISSSESGELMYKLSGGQSPVYLSPVCIKDVAADGEKVLKLFPSKSSDTLDHFVYEAQFNVAEGLNRCDDCMADAVSYVCASLLYNVFERYDAAKSFMAFATALCEENKRENND